MGFPDQHQNPPGLQSMMDPVPDCGEDSYVGSGRLTDKRAVITGGDSGIGRAVAIAFAREGADVLIGYLNEDEDAEQVAQLVRDAGRRCVLAKGDLSEPAECRTVIERAVTEFGGIDILVSNAAFQMTHENLDEISDEEWDYTLRLNVGAYFHLVKAAVPHIFSQLGYAVADSRALCRHEGRDREPLGELGPTAGRQGNSCQLRGSGPDLDATDSGDDAFGKSAELW
jgi:NAD(P)-dependent dehydrogenase (short-subunit alcohol dehydrogenase family)